MKFPEAAFARPPLSEDLLFGLRSALSADYEQFKTLQAAWAKLFTRPPAVV